MSKLMNISVPGLRSGANSVVSHSRRLPAMLASGLMLACAWAPAAAQDDDARTELEKVTIKASPFERSADELAQPVDVLYGEALDRKRGNTLGETLDGQLGVSSADFGPGIGRPVIRGQGGPRVLMLENGIASMDASSVSGDHAVAIDPSHAEQIEIIKGPATLIYGSAASAGVINVVNGRLPREVIPGLHGSVDLNWRDNAHQRAGALDLTAGFDEYVLRFDLSGRMADDLDIPGYAEADHDEAEHEAGEHEEEEEREGLLGNSSVETSSGSVTAAWLRPERILAVTVSRLRNNYGVPGHGHHEEHEEEEEEEHAEEEHGDVRILLQQQRLDANGEWFDPWRGIERLRARFGVNDYEHTELEGSEVGTVFDNRELEARIELTHAPLADWRGVFGLQLNDRDFEAIGDEAFVPPVESRSAGLFLVEERSLGAHRLELGARIEHVRHQAASNPDTDFTPLSLSAGFVYRLNEQHHLRLTASRSQRAPASEELYSYGPHLATNSFERGLNSLDVETANNLELGLDRHQGAWRWRLNLFLNQVQDYIYQSEVDQGRNADGSGNGIADGSADRVDEEGAPLWPGSRNPLPVQQRPTALAAAPVRRYRARPDRRRSEPAAHHPDPSGCRLLRRLRPLVRRRGPEPDTGSEPHFAAGNRNPGVHAALGRHRIQPARPLAHQSVSARPQPAGRRRASSYQLPEGCGAAAGRQRTAGPARRARSLSSLAATASGTRLPSTGGAVAINPQRRTNPLQQGSHSAPQSVELPLQLQLGHRFGHAIHAKAVAPVSPLHAQPPSGCRPAEVLPHIHQQPWNQQLMRHGRPFATG